MSTFLAFLITAGAVAIDDGPPNGIHTVVIDAGHGGHDPGAEGKRAREKDIALAIALKTGKYIEERIPDVKVIYTRTTDVFVELWRRAEIANEAEADLLISIHVNALHKPSIHGTMTLVLGEHRAGQNFDVAVRENSVILLEEDYTTRYAGFDPKSAESYIMFSLMQKTYFKQSIEFGDFVQDQFRERAGRRDLGVREQGLQVLALSAMPGVLVETGFITNAEEEKFLMSAYGQDIISSAIFRGFRDYKAAIDRRSLASVTPEDENAGARVNGQAAEKAAGDEEENAGAGEASAGPSQVIFSVQLASSRKETDTSPSSFKGQEGVWIIKDGKWFKYLAGKYPDVEAAKQALAGLKEHYPDAFVVASRDGRLIALKDAVQAP